MSETPTPPDDASDRPASEAPPAMPPPASEPAGSYQSAPPPPAYEPPRYGAPPTNTTYADWPTRAIGYLIDMLPGVAIYVVFWIIAAIAGGVGSGFGVFLVLVGALATIAFNVWNRWLVGGRTGQTLGRRVMGTRLVGESSGQPLGPGLAFARDIAHIIDSLICYIGWLFPLWDPKRQTIADKLLTSVVVPGEKQPMAEAFQWMRSQ